MIGRSIARFSFAIARDSLIFGAAGGMETIADEDFDDRKERSRVSELRIRSEVKYSDKASMQRKAKGDCGFGADEGDSVGSRMKRL